MVSPPRGVEIPFQSEGNPGAWMRLDPTSMTIHTTGDDTVVPYKQLTSVKRTRDGFHLVFLPSTEIKGTLVVSFGPEGQAGAESLAEYLHAKWRAPECWSCHQEIDVATTRCVACGKPFSKGVRRKGLIQIGIALVLGGIGGLLLYLQVASLQTWAGWGVGIAVILLLIGVLNLAGGEGLRGGSF